MNGERMAPDHFELVELEASFDDIWEITRSNGTNLGRYICDRRVQWLSGNVGGEFLYSRVFAERREDGSERTYTFKGELEDLFKLTIAKPEDVEYPKKYKNDDYS